VHAHALPRAFDVSWLDIEAASVFLRGHPAERDAASAVAKRAHLPQVLRPRTCGSSDRYEPLRDQRGSLSAGNKPSNSRAKTRRHSDRATLERAEARPWHWVLVGSAFHDRRTPANRRLRDRNCWNASGCLGNHHRRRGPEQREVLAVRTGCVRSDWSPCQRQLELPLKESRGAMRRLERYLSARTDPRELRGGHGEPCRPAPGLTASIVSAIAYAGRCRWTIART
jgi:hypothetical protein